MTAGDAHEAEDLVQTALVRVYLKWGKILTDPMAYARRALVNCFIDHRRKPASRREQLFDELPDSPAAPVPAALDPELVAALADLPPGMRAAVVLRHVHDLSVEAVAELVGSEPGTVRSQTARGLDKLRTRLAATPTDRSGART